MYQEGTCRRTACKETRATWLSASAFSSCFVYAHGVGDKQMTYEDGAMVE
jgi:hypothetical protein